MPSQLDLSVAVNDIDRTRPLVTGEVGIKGVDPTVLTLPSPERHRRMLKFGAFDVCELSLGSYLASLGQDYPFTAVPAFPHRMFRHGYYFVDADAGIDGPTDLEGARVGIRRWQNTAGVWMRGILEEYYEVDTTAIRWYVDDEDEVPVEVPDAYDLDRIPEGDDLNSMLVSGDLEAVMYPAIPTAFRDGHPDVERLFPDYDARDREYYRETGLFPLMHVVVVREEVLADHPWVATNVREAFAAANRAAIDDLAALLASRPSLRWGHELLAEGADGYDVLATERELWSSDLEDLRPALETVVRYAVRDGLLEEPIDPADLFAAGSTESLPETV